MLTPEALERAGDLVAAVYSEIEAEMCAALVEAMLEGDVAEWRAQVALANLSQGQAARLRAILERHRGDVDEAVRREVEEALERADADDLRKIKRAMGIDLPAITTRQLALAVRTVGEMLERDNVAMLDGARDAFFRESSRAVMETSSGYYSHNEAVVRATRRLAREGIQMVQYRDPTTGEKTVRNRVDVAVRRHVRTQLHQQSMERTRQLCEEAGCEFVEVSSHYGARPSHQDWEGRVYHVGGEVTVDGVTYADFDEATGYHGTGPHGALGDRLCGVNCRHSWGPWVPGMPRLYHPNPEHPSGRSNDEIYDLTQRQRAMERNIRATKRELSAAEIAYRRDPSLRNQVEVNKLRDRLRRQEQGIHDLVAENKDVLTREHNREWAGDMPRVNSRTMAEEQFVPGKGAGTDYDVNRRAVNGQSYRDKFQSLPIPKRAADTAYYEASRILRDCDGTAHERMAAISWKSGRLVGDSFNTEPVDFKSALTDETRRRAMEEPGGCVLLHNHPMSSRPSFTDIKTAAEEWVRSSVVICHDGTIYEIKCNDRRVIEAIEQVRQATRAAHPGIMDSTEIDEIAIETLYKLNEEARWFRLTTK